MTGADVTEQREAETALRTSEERYRQLVESSLGFICTHDLNGVLLSINSHAAATLGYEPEELIGTPLRNYIDTDHLADYDAYFEALKQDPDQDHQGRFYLRGKAGQLCIVAYRNKLLQLPGTDPFVLSHGIDITEQTQAEEELNALTRRHQSILDSVGDGIWGMDMEGRLTFINRSGAEMLGYSPQELLGQEHACADPSLACRRLTVPGGGVPYLRQREAGNSVACRRRCVLAERWDNRCRWNMWLARWWRAARWTALWLPSRTLRNGAGWTG